MVKGESPPFVTYSRKLWRSSFDGAGYPTHSLNLSMSFRVGRIQGPLLLFRTITSNFLRFSGRYIATSSLTTGSNAPVFSPSFRSAYSDWGIV
jgi:hypothetical protein